MIKKKLTKILGVALLSATVMASVSPAFANASAENASQDTTSISEDLVSSNDDEKNVAEDTEGTADIKNTEDTSNASENTDAPSAETEADSDAVEKEGWVESEDGNWYFYKNGEKVTGDYFDGPGHSYYFDENGVSAKGWTKIGENTYYFAAIPSGGYQMIYNHFIDGYYVDSYGIRQNINPDIKVGWIQSEDGSWRHYSNTGEMSIGLCNLGPNETYYFDIETGVSVSGWRQISGSFYYFKPSENGFIMARDETVDGYYVDSYGVKQDPEAVKQQGWVKSETTGEWFYYKENGKVTTGLQRIDGKLYFFDINTGASLSGWHGEKGNNYFFEPSEHGFVAKKA